MTRTTMLAEPRMVRMPAISPADRLVTSCCECAAAFPAVIWLVRRAPPGCGLRHVSQDASAAPVVSQCCERSYTGRAKMKTICTSPEDAPGPRAAAISLGGVPVMQARPVLGHGA